MFLRHLQRSNYVALMLKINPLYKKTRLNLRSDSNIFFILTSNITFLCQDK